MKYFLISRCPQIGWSFHWLYWTSSQDQGAIWSRRSYHSALQCWRGSHRCFYYPEHCFRKDAIWGCSWRLPIGSGPSHSKVKFNYLFLMISSTFLHRYVKKFRSTQVYSLNFFISPFYYGLTARDLFVYNRSEKWKKNSRNLGTVAIGKMANHERTKTYLKS